MLTLYKSNIHPLIESFNWVWFSSLEHWVRLTFWSQFRRWTKHREGCLNCSIVINVLPWTCSLSKVVYFKLTWLNVGQYFIMSSIHPEDLFALAPATGNWGHRLKQAHSHSSLEWYKYFFTLRWWQCCCLGVSVCLHGGSEFHIWSFVVWIYWIAHKSILS